MLTPLLYLLHASIAWTASWGPDPNGQNGLIVVSDGQKHAIKEGLGGSGSQQINDHGISITFKGHQLKSSGASIVDETSGLSVEVPHAPAPSCVFRSDAFMSLGNRLLWIFAWHDMESTFDPSVIVYAYEVDLRDSAPVVLRTVEVPGLVGYSSGARVIRQGNHLMLLSPENNLVEFDVSSWKTAGTADHCVFSPSGNIYRQPDDREIQRWLPGKRVWQQLRDADFGRLDEAAVLGGEDLLIFGEGLMLSESGRTYRNPLDERGQPVHTTLYLDPKLGVGLRAQNALAAGAQNMFLGTDLKPLCPIIQK